MSLANERSYVRAPRLGKVTTGTLPAAAGDAADEDLAVSKPSLLRVQFDADGFVLVVPRGGTAPTDVTAANGWPVVADIPLEFDVEPSDVTILFQSADAAGNYWMYLSSV